MPKDKVEETTEKLEEKVNKLETEIAVSSKEEVAPENADALKSELEQAKQELQRLSEEAKAHQRNVSKKDVELQREKEYREAISQKIDILAAGIAELMDTRSSDEEEIDQKPRKRRSEEYLEKLKEADTAKVNSGQEYMLKKAREADALLGSVGLKMRESPETLSPYIKFMEGNIEDAMDEIRDLVSRKKAETTEPKETEEQLRARLRKEVEREILEKRGELDAEDGQPAGVKKELTVDDVKGMTPEQIMARYKEIAKLPLV